MSTFVYFAQAALGPIKAGCTADVRSRIANFQSSAPCKVTLLLSLPGGWYLERKIRHQLRAARSHGEWLTPTYEVLALIERLRDGGAAALLNPFEMALDTFRSGCVAARKLGVPERQLSDWIATGGAPVECPPKLAHTALWDLVHETSYALRQNSGHGPVCGQLHAHGPVMELAAQHNPLAEHISGAA